MTRSDIINTLANKIQAKSYVEIGIDSGENFSQIFIGEKISVDPNPKIEVTHKMTSDDFFASLPPDKTFDIIFIDGLHLSDQVIKDVRNSIKHVSDNGFVVMHDCNPPTKEHQDVEGFDWTDGNHWPNKCGKHFGCNRAWNGDVWKAFLYFRATDPTLKMFTVDTDWGVGIIQKNKSQETVSIEPDVNYETFAYYRNEILNLISPQQFLNTINEL